MNLPSIDRFSGVSRATAKCNPSDAVLVLPHLCRGRHWARLCHDGLQAPERNLASRQEGDYQV